MSDTSLVRWGGPRPPVVRSTGADEYVTWSLVSGLLRRRWLTLMTALALSVGAAVVYLVVTPPRYEARASVLVEQERYNLPELVTPLEDPHGVSTQVELLKSETIATQVVRRLGLRLRVASGRLAPEHAPLQALGVTAALAQARPVARSEVLTAVSVADTADTGQIVLERVGPDRFQVYNLATALAGDTVGIGQRVALGGVKFTLRPDAARYARLQLAIAPLSAAVEGMREELTVVRPDRDASVIWIRYRAGDPELAAQVPDSLVEFFLASQVASAKAKLQTAVAFLREQADTLRQQLTRAEQGLRDFREREGIVSLKEQAASQVTGSAELSDTRTRLEAERIALERLVAADTATSEGPSPYRRLAAFPTLIDNPVISDLLQNLVELEDQRSELLLRRTAKDPEVQSATGRIAEVDAQLRGLTLTYLSGLKNQVGALDAALRDRARVAAALPGKSMQEGRLSRTPELLEGVYAVVQTRLQEARIAESAANPGVRIVDHAVIPTVPVWPRPALILVVALLVGTLGGGALAWLREGLDATVHSRADVVQAAGARVLGLVPHIRGVAQGGRAIGGIATHASRQFSGRPRRRLSAPDPSHQAALEAYAWLETSLTQTRLTDRLRTIAFTSPLAREGKTTSAANLALSVCRRGKRVLLVDADLRRGIVHHLFGVPRGLGLNDVLAGRAQLGEAIQHLPVDGGNHLHLLSRGERAGHAAALLRSGAVESMLAALGSHYDLVVLDTPPVNLVSDPLIIAGLVDGVVLVARAGITESSALSEAARHLQEAGAPLLGVLLNDINTQRDGSYDEAYRYLDQANGYAGVGGTAT